ncbi:hypothetical protein HDU79_003600, partial [Rhizoclosmatium sp. JEL0117]
MTIHEISAIKEREKPLFHPDSEMTIAMDSEQDKIATFVAFHPEYETDNELADVKYVREHIEFIVPQTDDPSTPAFTPRAIFLGTFFAVILSFANTCLTFRSNPFSIPSTVAVIISYPVGIFLSKVLPKGTWLNPGPFSIKEHILLWIICSASGTPYGIDNVVTQMHPDLMGNTNITFIEALAFILVTQFLGYGFSGLTRRFLVKPTAMWWPSSIPAIAMFTAFHKIDSAETGNRYTWSRFTVFWLAFFAMFAYEWIPEYFAPVLQSVSIGCLIAGRGTGKSGVLSKFNFLSGSTTTGTGLFGLTFDWGMIGSVNFSQPLWANATNTLGNIFFLWILTPLFYLNDVFGINAKLRAPPVHYFDTLNPTINSAALFVGNSNGTKPHGSRISPRYFYNISDNYNLNTTAFHVALWYGKDIYRQTKNALLQVKDEVDALDKHVQMMEAYPDVPDWCYLLLLGVCTAGGLLVSLFTPFGMPWWGIFFNIGMVSLFIVPYGSIAAMAGITLYLNVLSEFVIGLMIPGKTIAVMAFKSWATNNLIQAINLTSDLKFGQYMHIPPYAMVASQFIGTFINAIVSTAACWYMMFNTNGLVSSSSTDWAMPSYNVFYSAGGIWGAIGPQRFFGIGSIYENLLWCFLVGAAAPVIPWLGNKYI